MSVLVYSVNTASEESTRNAGEIVAGVPHNARLHMYDEQTFDTNRFRFQVYIWIHLNM